MQKAQIKWQEERQDRIDFINKKLMEEKKSEEKFTELGYAMREYYQVFGKYLQSLPPEPKLSDFYTPSNDQHDRELAFITISMIGVGAAIYYIYIPLRASILSCLTCSSSFNPVNLSLTLFLCVSVYSSSFAISFNFPLSFAICSSN